MNDKNPEVLRIERTDGVDWVTLNRPDRLNALDDRLVAALADYARGLHDADAPRVVVLRGAGRAFCAGLDLDGMRSGDALTADALLRRQTAISGLILALRRAPQPIVGLIHGAACGGGFALALASDIRIAATGARMNAAFIRLGLSGCDVGVSYLLPRLVGASVASELLFTGDFIAADRALATGLVSRVVEEADLVAAAEPFIAAMLAASPIGLRMTKECLRASIDAPSLESAIAMEDRTQVLCALGGNLAEGIAAFREKRPARY
ncbi:enoyl-CoA hydratase/isomerase family protein [Rhizorhabdus wittichii]|uniref:Enoyl-CoA hydratase/isomerase family protein n=1 Tax=Rhizorhabdus wittichii TaxID=160791 RepID=A0A975D614_9SPHN|nr:enoyl-CoA hydratase-related protein [Rhizorhabdus wittichii]QTH23374.1 enoyl-CoA hydratase/isomerase family protein [Rhizorhabdus wittichii]